MVPTIQSYARRARRLDRLNGKCEGVLAAMGDGAARYRLHQPNSILWVLSTGVVVTADVGHPARRGRGRRRQPVRSEPFPNMASHRTLHIEEAKNGRR